MKRVKTRRKPPAAHPNNTQSCIADRRLITVDDAPMRKRAATEFKRALSKLDKVRAEWQRFEQEDRPCFAQWMAATFGVLLTELRENERLVHEHTVLMHEVEDEMMWGTHRNPRKAYAAVMRRREKPDADDEFAEAEGAGRNASRNGPDVRGSRDFEADEPDEFDPFGGMGADIPDEDRREMFEDFLKSVFGINPKQMGEVEYAQMFAQFEADVLGVERRHDANPTRRASAPATGREETRIKEVYRTLARRLHPDMQSDDATNVSSIWHEVQDAYETRNLDRLETLLALTEMQGGENGGNASLAQIQGAVEELHRGIKAIQRSLRGAKRDPAWRFSQTSNRVPLEKRIRHELEASLSEQRWVLADLKRTLDDWSRPARQAVKKRRKQSEPQVKARAEPPRQESKIPKPVQTEFLDSDDARILALSSATERQ